MFSIENQQVKIADERWLAVPPLAAQRVIEALREAA